MHVLVTGGAGYIGSQLVRKLLADNHQVTVVDRLFFGEKSLDEVRDRIRLVKADTRTVDLDVFNGVDTVMDLAAISNDPAGELDKNKTYEINYLGRVRTAFASRLMGVRHYILASSCSVYGFQEGVLTEESPVNPLTTYANCNCLAEKAVLPLASDEFRVTVLRQATVFGYSKRMRFDLAINGMTGAYHKNSKLAILKDGTQWRPFVDINDTGRAFLLVMNSPAELVNGEIFNVGGNHLNVEIFSLAKRVTAALDKPFVYEWYGDPDLRSYKVSFDKIGSLLRYRTEVSIEESVRTIWDKLEEGETSFDDPLTKTVGWYKKLIESQQLSLNVSMNNSIL